MTAAPRATRRMARLAAVVLVAAVASGCGRGDAAPRAAGTPAGDPFDGLTQLQAVDVCVTYGRQHLPDHAFITASGAAAAPAKDLRAPEGTFRCIFAPPAPADPCDVADPTACARTTVLLDRAGVVHEYLRTSS